MEWLIETKRTYLRPFQYNDLVRLYGLYKDPKLTKYKGSEKYTRDRVKKILEAFIRHQTSFGYSSWAIISKDDSQFLGRAGLSHLEKTQEVDLTYAFHERFWNQGFATEVAQAVIEWGFDNTDKDYFTAIIDPKNFASLRVAEKIGLQFEQNVIHNRVVMRKYKIYRH